MDPKNSATLDADRPTKRLRIRPRMGDGNCPIREEKKKKIPRLSINLAGAGRHRDKRPFQSVGNRNSGEKQSRENRRKK